jgi:hypothetical protein
VEAAEQVSKNKNKESEKQQQQQKQQQPFDSETKDRIEAELQELHRNQQQQQNATSRTAAGGSKFLKFVDGQKRRLSFTGQFEKKQVQDKDFTTGELIPNKFSTRYLFSVYDITDPNHPIEQPWERGIKEAKTVLFWLSKNQQVLDVERHGKAGDKNTTYDIYPPMD